MRRYRRDDPEVRPSNRGVQELPMFATAPPARSEVQVGLDEERFQEWRRTKDGARAFAHFCAELIRQMRAGEKVSAKFAWETTRRNLAREGTAVSMNNTWHAIALREAERLHPILAGRAEKRRRKASI